MPAGIEAAAVWEVAAGGWLVMALGWPVTTPRELVSVRYWVAGLPCERVSGQFIGVIIVVKHTSVAEETLWPRATAEKATRVTTEYILTTMMLML